MGRTLCRYCRQIRVHAPRYPVRTARHSVGSASPRCDRHWRFSCAVCRKARHFHGIAYCDREARLFCIDCAEEHRAPRRPFWGWTYHYRLRCPWRSEWHEALDRLEYEGRHPWQTSRAREHARWGMSRTGGIEDRWTARVVPVKGITEEMSRRGWDRISEWWNSRYSPRGDVNREWVIDPALFRLLGPAQGLRVLDAGCGSGYLSRLLSAKGAAVVGVDLSPRLLEIARREESREPLRIEYHESDLARLSAFADASFDAVVSNVVMQDVVAYREAFREFGRVLRPGGRLVFSITHPCFDRPVPARWLREPPDSERIEEWPGLLVNRYYDRVAVWWSPAGKPSVVGFHRTLEDYVGALHDAGFVVSRMEEPVPSRDAVRRMYRQFADYVLAPNFLIIEAHRPSR